MSWFLRLMEPNGESPERNEHPYRNSTDVLLIKGEKIDWLMNDTWTIDYMEENLIPTSKHVHTHFV